MGKTIIKICGINSVLLANVVKAGGADLIGMVFAPGPRLVTVQVARAISREVPGIGKVGVFANAPLAEVRAIAHECKLDFVQLHGSESPEYCRQVGTPVIKAIRADCDATALNLENHPAAWMLLDSSSKGRFGGTGVTFDWYQMKAFRDRLSKPLMIAGGLNSGNVQEAISVLKPQGVDVSSGVETDGVKQPDKIAEFIKNVRKGGG